MEEAPDVVFVVIRDAVVGGAYRGVRKVRLRGSGSWRDSNVAMGRGGDVIVGGRR